LFIISLKTKYQGWLSSKATTVYPTDDGRQIFYLCCTFLEQHWQGQGVWQVRIVALNLQSEKQADLFEQTKPSPQREKINQTVDGINEKFGEFAIAPSRLITRSEMPNVIAPSWQPSGHRKTV
jgi:DNA polymerase-4